MAKCLNCGHEFDTNAFQKFFEGINMVSKVVNFFTGSNHSTDRNVDKISEAQWSQVTCPRCGVKGQVSGIFD